MLSHLGYRYPQLLPRSFSVASTICSAASGPLQVCVVGSGPAGFYAADQLAKSLGADVHVDILDRLPTPFGLVRSGVAPDHADTKKVINQFSEVARKPQVNFLGNVNVGKDISLAELRSLYHAVVLAYGAESDRPLRIPGEDSKGVFAAREFVWWYNGHPDAADLPIDLSKVESVAVCGIGNVALDCARVLLRPVEQLATTDIAQHALQQLQRISRVKEVHLCARRGPVQAACTPKELKEVVNLEGVSLNSSPSQLQVSAEDQAAMKATRMRRRIYDLVSTATQKQYPRASRHLYFQFYRNPVEVLADGSGQVTGLKVEKTRLQVGPSGAAVAVGTGEFDTYPVQLVLKSIGYKSLPLEGVAFDPSWGVVPNAAGRVLKGVGSTEVDRGMYVCGWVKRGPTGIIGTNQIDAEETVACILQDRDSLTGDGKAGLAGLKQLLAARGVQFIPWDGWEKLNDFEVQQGQAVDKPREKVVGMKEMLDVALGT